MRKIAKYMFLAMVMTFTVAACGNKEGLPEENTSEEGFTYKVTVGDDVKSVLDDHHMAWSEGDLIGWFTDQPGHSAIDTEANPKTFEVSSTAALPAGSKIYAFAPYYAYMADYVTVDKAELSIPRNQDGSNLADCMPMVSLPIVISEAMAASTDTPIGQASFLNLGALIHFNVYTTNASYNTEKVESVKFTSSSDIAGDFTVDLTAVALNAIPAPSGLTVKSVLSTLNTATTVGSPNKESGIPVYMVVAPGTFSGTIEVRTNVAKYSYNLESTIFNRAQFKTININLGSANATRSVIEYREYYHDFVAGDWGITSGEASYFNWNITNPYDLRGDGIWWTWRQINNDNPVYNTGGYFITNKGLLQIGDYGSGVRDYILSTSDIPGTITEISIPGASDNPFDVSCKVGGKSYGLGVITTDGGDFNADFTGSASGEITITFHATDVMPVWLDEIYVGYRD